MPGTVPATFTYMNSLYSQLILCCRCYYYPHFTNETDNQRGYVTCLLHSWWSQDLNQGSLAPACVLCTVLLGVIRATRSDGEIIYYYLLSLIWRDTCRMLWSLPRCVIAACLWVGSDLAYSILWFGAGIGISKSWYYL